jgi:hypothetical protein
MLPVDSITASHAAGNRLRPLLSFSATVIWLPVLYATEHAIAGDNGLKTLLGAQVVANFPGLSLPSTALVPFLGLATVSPVAARYL